MIRVLVINDHEVKDITIENSLEAYYKELECDCFDIVTATVNGREFDIFCDDNGLFAEFPRVSAITPNREPMLVGNLLLAHHDHEGNTIGLTEDDIEFLDNTIFGVFSNVLQKVYPILGNVEYF